MHISLIVSFCFLFMGGCPNQYYVEIGLGYLAFPLSIAVVILKVFLEKKEYQLTLGFAAVGEKG